ncbi:MAG: TonB-dependent receptor [Pseudomonadota bacterium]
MKKYACLLLLCAPTLQAAEAENESLSIEVEATRLSDVSGEELKSADLAEALTKKVPSVSLVRRSGIANDIIVRGQKKDNINILIDGAKVYGACPNRMDPPTSHVLTNNIEGVDITEGPYDVENFGTLSGAVSITTKEPSEETHGEAGVNVGSWNYRKQYATVSGGSERFRILISASNESSDQYEDGDGNDFYQQIENLGLSGPAASVQYKDEYKDQEAYQKQTMMGKIYADITDDQQLRLSYTTNRSDDVLYPSSKMDALYDDSDIFNAEYTISNLGAYSSALDLNYYNSRVDHPMSTYYRTTSGATDSDNEMVSALTTEVNGFKIKNRTDLDNDTGLILGVDTSVRNWDGEYEKEGMMASMIDGRISIDDVDTTNRAFFAELEKRFGATSVKTGLRYDDTHIETAGNMDQPDNDYTGIGANVFVDHQLTSGTRLFGGVGRANRVPDARELYFFSAMGMMQPEVGTPDLEQTTNTEFDFGAEQRFDSATLKVKFFYSMLEDYIYYNADKATNAFENIDATIYGGSLTGSWFATDTVYFDLGLAYQRGEKDEPLEGQTDKDLAEIPPAKLNLALNYDYAAGSTARLEMVAVDDWTHFDEDNGEQAIDGYQVFNLKAQHALTKNIELTAGVDNLTNETYATTNTYKDLTLLFDAEGDVMLINEPGRYYYLNAAYKF